MDVFSSAADLSAAVGREMGPSDWTPVEQDRVDAFAEVTGDHQWIHVDTERAATGPFGGTIAHGFLTLSMLPVFISAIRRIDNQTMGINYGLNKVRFPTPVRVGSRVRGRATFVEVEPLAANAVQVVTRIVIDVEGSDKPCCIADMVTRHYFAAPTEAASTEAAPTEVAS